MIINIDGLPVEIIRKKIKRINLRIYPPDALIKVSVPLRFNEQLLRDFLYEKRVWIRNQRTRILANAPIKTPLLQTGTTVDFLGKSFFLLLIEHQGPTHISIKESTLYMYVKPQMDEEQKQRVLDRWYRQEMVSLVPALMTKWEALVSVSVTQWGIKKMKTRWGSCNTRAKRIWLNLSLIKKPLACLEYVLVHELVHLHEASHNTRFYKLMSQFMPDWRAHQMVLEGKQSPTLEHSL